MENTPLPPQNQGKRSVFRSIVSSVGELARVVIISLAIILPIRYFLVQPFYVKGASMEPNFYDHEYLIIDELSFRFRELRRGEIVVFRYPRDHSQFFIKRVIGLPEETIEIRGEKINIKSQNHPEGFILDEPYVEIAGVMYGDYTAILGADEYYLLGDNRASSLDSRSFGAVARELIVGRAWIRGWPLDRITRFIAPVYEVDGNGTEARIL